MINLCNPCICKLLKPFNVIVIINVSLKIETKLKEEAESNIKTPLITLYILVSKKKKDHSFYYFISYNLYETPQYVRFSTCAFTYSFKTERSLCWIFFVRVQFINTRRIFMLQEWK